MNVKTLLIPATILSIALSGPVLAKKPEGHGNPHHDGPDARWENSNRQSDESSLRGRDRADERHYLKKQKKHKDKKEKKYKHKKDKHHKNDRYDDEHDRYERRRHDSEYDRNHQRYNDDRYRDRYERQRYQEKYQNNPVRTIIDQNVNKTKSKIDDAHRRVIDSIDQKSREFTGIEPRSEQRKTSKPWWYFGSGE